MKKLIKVTFLVPDSVSISDLPPSEHILTIQALEKQLANIAGGYSKRGGVEGAWVDDNGLLIKDILTEYTVACQPSHLAAIRQLVSTVGGELHQAAMYLEVANTPEIVSSTKGGNHDSPIAFGLA